MRYAITPLGDVGLTASRIASFVRASQEWCMILFHYPLEKLSICAGDSIMSPLIPNPPTGTGESKTPEPIINRTEMAASSVQQIQVARTTSSPFLPATRTPEEALPNSMFASPAKTIERDVTYNWSTTIALYRPLSWMFQGSCS